MKRLVFASASPDELNPNAYLVDLIVEEANTLADVDAIKAPHRWLASVVESVRPHAVIVMGSVMGADATLARLSQWCRRVGAPFVYWTWDDPFELDANRAQAGLFTQLFSNDATSCGYYGTSGEPTFLPMAGSERAHFRPIQPAVPMWDWLLVGHGFGRRRSIVEQLEREHPDLVGLVSGGGWEGSSTRSLVPGPIPNDRLADLYNRSGCVLSIGREENLANVQFDLPAAAAGPRVYEAALAGAPQILVPLNDPLPTEADLVGVVAAKDDVAEVVRQFVVDRKHHLSTCIELQQTVMNHHLYRHRVTTILDRIT
jgi:spore maturation protein CgeB